MMGLKLAPTLAAAAFAAGLATGHVETGVIIAAVCLLLHSHNNRRRR